MSHLKPYDIHGDLLIERYRHGIRLVKPVDDINYKNSIASIYDMPEPWFFLDTSSKFMSGNEELSKLVNAAGVSDMLGKNAANFCKKEFSSTLLANDQAIMHSQSTGILEEAGSRRDDVFMHALALKFPWYHNDQIIGLLGCSVMVKSGSLGNTAKSLTQIMMTGLLGQDTALPLKKLAAASTSNVYYSKRELQILKLILKGLTARQISEMLFRSRRTIEHYIETIKVKAGCRSKYELICKYSDEI